MEIGSGRRAAAGRRRPVAAEHPSLGEQERDVLAYITEHAPVTASQVAQGFGETRGLARTTVLTVIERLRKKGYVQRHRRQGVFHYSPRMEPSEVLQGLVHRFVETTLGGSLSPVIAYLVRTRRLSEAELAELQQLVQEMEAPKGDER
jgi:predicted transcriptional regulator